ncbi:MAG: NB-ARC domain-containing protein [Marinibacterium sp.]
MLRKLRGQPEPPQRVVIVDPPGEESEPPPPPSPLDPGFWSGFPQGDPLIGRDYDIAEMHMRLNNTGEVAVVNSGAIVAGQGGIGKTSLARGFADKHRRNYNGGLWVGAQSRCDLIDGLMALAGPMGVDVKPPYDAAQARAVIAALQGCEQKWLLVYDNVEKRGDLDGLIPDKTCRHIHLIVTTREKDGWAGVDVIEADTLSTEKPHGPAVALLLREAGKPDDGK